MIDTFIKQVERQRSVRREKRRN